MSITVVLIALAVGSVAVGVSLIVRLDGALASGGRFATPPASVPISDGLRAHRRHERKVSPVLYILSSVLALLVIAALV